jgi:hypothetical protein
MQGEERRRRVTPQPFRRLGGRDFLLTLECTADAVVLQPWGTHFSLNSLSGTSTSELPLLRAIEQRIAQRQAAVAPGEPPYRPIIRFQVRPDGLRAYYQSYPLVASLGLPMSREDLDDYPNGKN